MRHITTQQTAQVPTALASWLAKQISAEKGIDGWKAYLEAVLVLSDPATREQAIRAKDSGVPFALKNSAQPAAGGEEFFSFFDRSATVRLANRLMSQGISNDKAIEAAYVHVTSDANKAESMRRLMAERAEQQAMKLYAAGEGAVIRCGAADLSIPDATARPVWNQIARVGSFRGHPAGPFELNPIIFDEIVRNFTATQNRRVPVDFEHASEASESSGTIPSEGAPAQGWITQLDNRGMNGLWGLVEWLEPARTYIREGKYRYFSPAIRFGARDRVTGQQIGARLTSGALTNMPFLDGLAPVRAMTG